VAVLDFVNTTANTRIEIIGAEHTYLWSIATPLSPQDLREQIIAIADKHPSLASNEGVKVTIMVRKVLRDKGVAKRRITTSLPAAELFDRVKSVLSLNPAIIDTKRHRYKLLVKNRYTRNYDSRMVCFCDTRPFFVVYYHLKQLITDALVERNTIVFLNMKARKATHNWELIRGVERISRSIIYDGASSSQVISMIVERKAKVGDDV